MASWPIFAVACHARPLPHVADDGRLRCCGAAGAAAPAVPTVHTMPARLNAGARTVFAFRAVLAGYSPQARPARARAGITP